MAALSLPTSTKTLSIHIQYNSSLIRLFFRLYLGILFFAISLIGNTCCAERVKLRLMGGQKSKLTHMTGWLPGWTPLIALWKMKTLLVGWLGLLMVFVAVLTLACDLAVTTLIQDEVVASRCPFGTGLVLNSTPGNGSSLIPPTNGAPYFVAAQAQITSQTNGGLGGIYAKVNRSLNFSADASDVLGNWNCQPNSTELEYPSDIEVNAIVSDLVQRGRLYGPGPPSCTSNYGEGASSHLIVWDSSVADSAQAPFNVGAAIDFTGSGSDSKLMQTFECQISTLQLDSILSTIASKSTLKQSCLTLQGAVYDGWYTPASNDTGSILEETLNSIVMVAGGDNYLHNTTAPNETQGCLVFHTEIHLVVIILTSMVTLIALLLLVYWIALIVLKQRCKKTMEGTQEKAYLKSVNKYTPGDIFGWMAQAIREGEHRGADIKPKHLRKWQMGPAPDWVGICVSQDQEEESSGMQRPTSSADNREGQRTSDGAHTGGGPGQNSKEHEEQGSVHSVDPPGTGNEVSIGA
jgi:hypothetical protein